MIQFLKPRIYLGRRTSFEITLNFLAFFKNIIGESKNLSIYLIIF